jgi:hypothetical protein
MAKVTSIVYRRLMNTGKYENEAIEMRADLGKDDDWGVEFFTLKSRVLEAAGLRDEAGEAWNEARYRMQGIESATGRPYGVPAEAVRS